MYIQRLFQRFYKGKINVLTAYKEPGKDYVIELTEEDLQALVDIRRKKMEDLKSRLDEIGKEVSNAKESN